MESRQSPQLREGHRGIAAASTTPQIHDPAKLSRCPTMSMLVPVSDNRRNDKFHSYHPAWVKILNHDDEYRNIINNI